MQLQRFAVDDLVHHRRFDYRAVVVDIDPLFRGTDDAYDRMGRSQPSKDAPWYLLLADGTQYHTDVAPGNLEADTNHDPTMQPLGFIPWRSSLGRGALCQVFRWRLPPRPVVD